MLERKPNFLDFFEPLEDPRIERKKLYPMEEILLLTLCGVAAGFLCDVQLLQELKEDCSL